MAKKIIKKKAASKKIIKKKNTGKKIMIDQNMIDVLGIANISPAKQKKIVQKLEENIQRKIVLSVLENLSKDEEKLFNEVLKLKDKDMTSVFISSTIPDVQDFIKNVAIETIREFKQLSVR